MQANAAPPRSGELRDILDAARATRRSSTLAEDRPDAKNLHVHDIAEELARPEEPPGDPAPASSASATCSVRNPDAMDGLFKVAGRRVSVYGRELDVGRRPRSGAARSVK